MFLPRRPLQRGWLLCLGLQVGGHGDHHRQLQQIPVPWYALIWWWKSRVNGTMLWDVSWNVNWWNMWWDMLWNMLWDSRGYEAYNSICWLPATTLKHLVSTCQWRFIICTSCIHICICICMYIFEYIYVYVYIYIHMYMHMYMYMCVCACICGRVCATNQLVEQKLVVHMACNFKHWQPWSCWSYGSLHWLFMVCKMQPWAMLFHIFPNIAPAYYAED